MFHPPPHPHFEFLALAVLQIGDIAAPMGSGIGSLAVVGKGNKARTLPICADAQAAISSYVGDPVDGPVYLVLNSDRPLSLRAIQARFKKLAIEADIPAEKQDPHCMRHGFATGMLFDTKTIGGIYTLSNLLRHSRVAATVMYRHCSQKQLEQAMLADPLGVGV